MIRSALLLSSFFILLGCHPNRDHAKSEGAFVKTVYPTSDTLPENLLRMYVKFSEPMKTVGNLERIVLRDSDKQKIKGAIFNNVYELWSPDQKELTLLPDPARVKTGLIANETLGRALVPGRYYELVIEGLENIQHQKMAEVFTKRFYITSADTLAPNINNWMISAPVSDTHNMLTLRFPDALDQHSLQQRIAVVKDDDTLVEGNVSLAKGEKEWQFTPLKSWKAGLYFIYVNARLEDPAGNNLNGLFDHKIGDLRYEKEGENLRLSFEVK